MQTPPFSLFTEHGERKYTDDPEYRRFMEDVQHLPLLPRTYCQILAVTGCRASEGLMLRRLHLTDNQLIFHTLKRRRTVFRLVPIPEWLAQQFLMLAAALSDPAGRIFPESRSTAYRWVRRVFLYADNHGTMASPKGLRHGFGVRCAMFNLPGSLIQTLMGHASYETTRIYLDLVGNEARTMIARTW